MRIENNIPNLVNGVSQQSPALRLSTQAELQTNAYSTVVEGLKKRPPRIFVGIVGTSLGDNIFSHTMVRNEEEQYELLIGDGHLEVFNKLTGEVRPVGFPDGKDYLSSGDPKRDFAAVTVKDYTFITNKTVATAMSDEIAPERPNEALVYVRAGNYGRKYRIEINGEEVAFYRPGDGIGENPEHDLETVDTENIAMRLTDGSFVSGGNSSETDEARSNLMGTLDATFEVTRYGNVIHIKNETEDFTISTDDGYGGDAMYAIKGAVQTFSKLPENGPEGFTVKVYGGETNDLSHYYLRLEKDGTGGNSGNYRECPAPGEQIAFDPATMPHVLTSDADGGFTFRRADYDKRVAGDAEELPPMEFVGDAITDITFHRKRLIFLSGETVAASRPEDYFNFWRTTATALLDDDPISTPATHDKVSTLHHAVPFLNDLFLFSSETQFVLTADKLLTPKTVSIDPTTEFESSEGVKPVAVGSYVYFVANRGSHASVQEYYLADEYTGTYDTNDTTNHVPAYLPAGVFKMVASSADNILFALTEGDPSTIYVYRYYWSGRDKLQASWSRWTLEEGTTVLNADITRSVLRLVVRYANGDVAFERLPLDPSYADPHATYPTLLDRRVSENDLAPAIYDEDADETYYMLPYEPGEVQAVTRCTADGDGGQMLVVNGVDGGTVRLDGDTRDVPLFIGTPYRKRYVFSEFFVREEATGGGVTVKTEGRLQLSYLSLVYADTTAFDILVTPKGRKTYRYSFSGYRSGETAFGELPIASGICKVPLLTKSQGAKVEIVNDTPFPSNIMSATWTAKYVPKTRSV